MELDNSFTVPVPPETAWDVLLDVARIAPCMPGATVDEVDGDVVNGRIKVKVGPVSLTYKGTATFAERDVDSHSVTVEASGKETRGAGTASATVKASLAPADGGGSTLVTMHTTMNVTGRPAQFGRGVIVEVGGKLVDQFAGNLAQMLSGDSAAGAAEASDDEAAAGASGAAVASNGSANGSAPTGYPPTAPSAVVNAPAQEESLNLLKLVGPAILKRIIPVAALGAALALLTRRLRRASRRRSGA
ncbi:MAG TPA: SRPBCC family protein [Streptosporangiaceae bacterium]|nr:SRPBCC family protein [Streptosporangiaceae bacterium]